ncbi:LysR family transcriptional regulator [Shewanella saliphila]|uniref:LysR family transcriptional regulator n=1 Tax=Shewanella saliphila TaxID=2282698 RepID=A0ABQ2QA76_9GAMM|nr:LysR family transcriptional regulator [Shewanella saliphila]MCL1102936.1 LysR family transcriptional regulator [Shewanella saliphila]GGP63490.1 LysR family transcriptional regulator [Shewanella saliphila]
MDDKQSQKLATLDLNLLRVFCVVCQQSSITRAAEQLAITQSSVSNAINRLKTALDCELFIRVGRGIEPTASGLHIFNSVQPMLDAIEQTLRGISEFDPHTSTRVFTIYANESVIDLLQPLLDKALASLSVRVVLRNSPVLEAEQYQDLQMQKVDLVIDIVPPKMKTFSFQKVAQEQIVCVVREQHPHIKQQVSLEQYFAAEHVMYRFHRDNMRVADIIAHEPLPPRTLHSEHTSLLSMLSLISKSNAIGIAPYAFTQSYAQLFKLKLLKLPFETRPIELFSIWPSKHAQDKSCIWLRETIETLMKQAYTAIKKANR